MIGKTVGIAGEQLTGNEMAEAMSKSIGQQVVYNKIPPAVYRGFGFPGADDLGNMFQFYDEFASELNEIRNVNGSKELNPELLNFDQWLEKYGKRIPVE